MCITIAIILGAGIGARYSSSKKNYDFHSSNIEISDIFNCNITKIYENIAFNRTSITMAIYAFLVNNNIDIVLPVIDNSHEKNYYKSLENDLYIKNMLKKQKKIIKNKLYKPLKLFSPQNRYDSTFFAMQYINAIFAKNNHSNDISYSAKNYQKNDENFSKKIKCCKQHCQNIKVLIHDAARPFVSQKIIDSVIEKLYKDNALAVDVSYNLADNVRFIPTNNHNINISSIDRRNLYTVQTPQGFDFKTIYNIYCDFYKKEINQQYCFNIKYDFLDDIQLYLHFYNNYSIVRGERMNFKITEVFDLIFARSLLLSGIIS